MEMVDIKRKKSLHIIWFSFSISLSIFQKTFHKTYSNNCLNIITKQQQQNQQHLYTIIPCEKLPTQPRLCCHQFYSYFFSVWFGQKSRKKQVLQPTTTTPCSYFYIFFVPQATFDNFGHKYNNNGNNEASEGIVPHIRAVQHPFFFGISCLPDCLLAFKVDKRAMDLKSSERINKTEYNTI